MVTFRCRKFWGVWERFLNTQKCISSFWNKGREILKERAKSRLILILLQRKWNFPPSGSQKRLIFLPGEIKKNILQFSEVLPLSSFARTLYWRLWFFLSLKWRWKNGHNSTVFILFDLLFLCFKIWSFRASSICQTFGIYITLVTDMLAGVQQQKNMIYVEFTVCCVDMIAFSYTFN